MEFIVEEINSQYFYNSLKKSFDKEKYKSLKGYKHFIKKDQIISLKDMEENVSKLLEGYEMNLYVKDPWNFDKFYRK